ncbi:MAG: hypothetical protein H6732_07830 [Alphaproteobacteria bacterium]|nr:hypothetical protein [Alphaproteobacteria bacterium]
MKLRLRSWLLLSHLAVLAVPVAFLVMTGLLRFELARQAGNDVDRRALVVGRLVAGQLALEEARGGDRLEASRRLMALLEPHPKDHYPVHTWLYDGDGGLLASTAGAAAAPPSTAGLARALEGDKNTRLVPDPDAPWASRLLGLAVPQGLLVAAAPVRFEPEAPILGAVVLARTPAHARRLAWVYLFPMQALAAFAIGVTALLALSLADRIGSSLQQLAGTIRRIAAGETGAAVQLDGAVSSSHLAEVRELAADVQRMAGQIEARLAFVQDFASNVAHEFRTPLSTLVGAVELLQDDLDMPVDERARFLRRADEQLVRLRTLIDGLLALARAERAVREPVDLDALLDTQQGDDLVREGHAGAVPGDLATLRLVLANLVQNARQHGTAPVRLVGWREEGRAGFDVIDAGQGIAPDVLPQIWERFFTTDRERGVGLGLALVRTIVEAHGGAVEVDGTPGAVRFRVALPS